MIGAMNAMEPRDPAALLAYVPVSARRVLDCSCGDGARARLLKARSAPEITGFEPEADLAAQAAQVVDRMLPANALDADLPIADGHFECVVCDDLLAQWRDPAPVLQRLARVLSADGLFVASFPNLRHHKSVAMLAEGRWTYEERGILARRHLRFFTAPEIVRLLRGAGFDPRGFAALRAEDPGQYPLDAARCLRLGRTTIGPLDDEEYRSFLTEEYVVLAMRGTA